MSKNEKKINIAMILINFITIFMCLLCLKVIDDRSICMIISLIMMYSSADSIKKLMYV